MVPPLAEQQVFQNIDYVRVRVCACTRRVRVCADIRMYNTDEEHVIAYSSSCVAVLLPWIFYFRHVIDAILCHLNCSAFQHVAPTYENCSRGFICCRRQTRNFHLGHPAPRNRHFI